MPSEQVITIIAPGMRFVGDCDTEGTIRVDGMVEGSIRAGTSVVIGKDGVVTGNVSTRDVIVAGRICGNLVAESRVEFQPGGHLEGDVRARRMQVGEGAVLNGSVAMVS